MKFCTALMLLLASAGYLSTVLSFPLVDNSGGANGLNDGYVNTTATTVNAPPQGFAKRQSEKALNLIMTAITDYPNKFEGETRTRFTQDAVTTLWNANPHYNYVICHVAHDYTFHGVQGVDWDHQEIKFSTRSELTVGYDVIVGGAGYFIRKGDGGFINWAYMGNIASRIEVGRNSVVTFNAP
ncbi:hypothetical protein JOM56_014563 [Amanita muscaria]